MKNNKIIIFGVLIFLVAVGVVYGMYQYRNTFFKSVETSASKDMLLIDISQRLEVNDFEQATKLAEESLKNDNKNIEKLILLASVYAHRGSAEFKEQEFGQKAVDLCNQAISIQPTSSEAYRVQGYAYEIMSKWPQSIVAYNKSVELNPGNAKAFVNRGHVYNLLGNLDVAVEDYQQALKIDPSETDALFNLARVSFVNKNTKDAKSYLNRALQGSSAAFRTAEIYQVLSVISLSEGSYSDAYKYINKSISYNDQSPVAYVTRGEITRAELAKMVFASEKISDLDVRIDSILNDASKATSLNVNQTGAVVLMAKLSVLLGENNQAVKMYEKSLEMIDQDITLGSVEKKSMREEILKNIKIIKANTK